MINKLFYVSMACGLMLSVTSCENQKFNDTFVDVDRVHVDTLSAELQKVRDYVPDLAVVAHRGTTYWAPEETEAAYRWAREMGADYLEADLQVSKDGVILALHDTDLKRTTDIEDVFGERFPEKQRREYYKLLGYDDKKIETLIARDRECFVPNYPSSYTYYELLMLDAGSWFDEDPNSMEQAREKFKQERQYISTLEDLIKYSKGYRLVRFNDSEYAQESEKIEYCTPEDAQKWNQRLVVKLEETKDSINNPVNVSLGHYYTMKDPVVRYTFGYKQDEHFVGHVPGIYIEFKEPWLNPSKFEEMVYNELARVEDMNIIVKKEPENTPFYRNGYVNVGNTNGKVILQTFSLQSLRQVCDQFEGQVPMCFLLWLGNGPTDLSDDSPVGYASFINLGVQFKAHFIGPCIAGAPNNYPELNKPWQHAMIHRAKMKNHPYSFDSYDQMGKYFGLYNWGIEFNDQENITRYKAPYVDAYFTNHTDMSLQFMKDHVDELNISDELKATIKAKVAVPDAREMLDELGY